MPEKQLLEMTLVEIIEEAWQRSHAEFNLLYPIAPVPAELTTGCDILRGKLLELIDEIQELYEEAVRKEYKEETPR